MLQPTISANYIGITWFNAVLELISTMHKTEPQSQTHMPVLVCCVSYNLPMLSRSCKRRQWKSCGSVISMASCGVNSYDGISIAHDANDLIAMAVPLRGVQAAVLALVSLSCVNVDAYNMTRPPCPCQNAGICLPTGRGDGTTFCRCNLVRLGIRLTLRIGRTNSNEC